MKLERVVVGIDFSETSDTAAAWATRHFAGAAEVILVYVVEVPRAPEFLRPLLPPQDELVATLRSGGEQRLRELAGRLGAERLRTEIRVGRPADCLARVAQESEADLIVVGEHGRRRSFGTLLGSTAEQLVRRSPVPVLLARGLPPDGPRTILLPIDAADVADDVLAWGSFLRERFDADTIALHTVSPMLYGRVSVISSVPRAQSLEEKMLSSTRAWLRERLERAGLPSDEAHAYATFGDPGHEINAAARRFDVDLVVMGSGGAGSAGRLILGSTAGTVLRGATCPVLVLHDTPEEGGAS